MRKDTEEVESPKRSIRDSGYIDCWDSERSDSLSPPRHGRDDSFDSLDSFGSRSQQTPSPDVVLRGSSDGRGSDSESDLSHRKLPDVKKDDMSARRTSYSEPKSVVPFNQYLPNKSNQTAYIPAPLRKKKAERDDFRKSWSTMSSPLGGERPLSKRHPETIEEEPLEGDFLSSRMTTASPSAKPVRTDVSPKNPLPHFLTRFGNQTLGPQNEKNGSEEIGKLRKLEQAGIKIRPASHRNDGSPKPVGRVNELTRDIILRRENPFTWCYQPKEVDSEEEGGDRVPDLEKDDFAVRRARLHRREQALPFAHFLLPLDANQDWKGREARKTPKKNREGPSGKKVTVTSTEAEFLEEVEPAFQSEEEGRAKIPETRSHELAKKPIQASSSQPVFLSITPKDKEIWDRLKVSGETSEIILTSSEKCNSPVQEARSDTQRQQPSGLDEWHENSEEESDDHFPDLERDDMMVRRFGAFPKAISSLLPANQLAICNSPSNCPRKVAGQSEPKLRRETEKTERNVSLLCVTPPGHGAPSFISKDQNEQKRDPEHEKVGFQNPEKVDVTVRRTEGLSKQAESCVSQLIPLHFSKQHSREEELIRTGKQAKRSGCRTPVSDDAESLSMFDMRSPDEGAVHQPHSKARHEKLQIVHHQLKEDEDQWQDDLARWKTRRRSASQDLLKKEAERKKMEQLLTGGEGNSERRKSIKTYREIVEEKEKRERELHEAYKNARSQEEAYNILQHYIERFTISEAVLERLEMPKLLERSHSVEPNSLSPSTDPNPLQYLRQHSLPAPKFTSKFEATISPAGGSDGSTPTCSPSSSRPPVSVAMPLVTPKPYAQPKDTQEILRNFKIDGKITMNGEASHGVEGEPDKESSGLLFEPSASLSAKPDQVVKLHGGSREGSADPTPELVQKSFIDHSGHREQVDSLTEEVEPASQKEGAGSEEMFLDFRESSTKFSCANLTAAHVGLSSVHNHPDEIESNCGLNSTREPKTLERGEQNGTEASASQQVQIETLEAPKQGEDLLLSLLKKVPETTQGVLLDVPLQDQKAATENKDMPNRSACWAWDPEEERRRQERWQKDQERLLQERYQQEQEKLKKAWEKAQKEVEEEERKYYEEERKILEDTVVPFLLTSSSAEPLSTSSSLTDGNRTMNLIDLSYSEDENKPNEEAKLEMFREQDGRPFSKHKEYQPWEEIASTVNKEEYLEGLKWRQTDQVPTPEGRSPNKMSLPLSPGVPWNQPLGAERSPGISDVRQKDSPLGHNLGLAGSSPKEVKRAASQGSSRSGPSSPCSPAVQSQPSNRSVSGKKLCSSCGHPLGKGAAMIIETLGLYFHIQCFRCGICKGQLGDAATGTDVRIKNGLLTCSDCYNKSRTAGQPTTL